MNFEHTETRRMLADSLDRFISDRYPLNIRNESAYGERPYARDFYQSFAELGVIGALFREEDGGFGGEGFDISVVFESLGKGLVDEPILGALLVGKALVIAGNSAQKALLEELISGSCVAAFAHDEPGSHYDLSHVSTTATKVPGGWILNGDKGIVSFGDQADVLLVSARTNGGTLDSEGISLFLVPTSTTGLKITGYSRIEGGLSAEVTLRDVQLADDSLLGVVDDGFSILERISGYGVLALCAEAVGVMDVAKEQTLEYLRTRKQFGVPIGSFQALQHRMADLLLEIEQFRSSVINVASSIDHDEYQVRERAIAAAKFTLGHVGHLVAEDCIQLHGGIGMTWELALSHYAKRLVMIDHQFGDMDHHLDRYIAISSSSVVAAE